MVQAGDGLETNTNYAYLLLCDHFSETTLVAESDQMIVGFVAAYVLPKRPDTVFVWQVGVTPATRGRGIAGSLLDALRRSLARRRVRFLEATVTPDNTASRRLFESFANRCAADFAWSKGYDSALFLEQHASEQSIRVGPFPTLMSPKTPDRGSPE
jgi:L-2,4-diaminobutyric acid acetyltransferase